MGRVQGNNGRYTNRSLSDAATFTFIRDTEQNAWGFPKALRRSDMHTCLQHNSTLTIRCVVTEKPRKKLVKEGGKRKRRNSSTAESTSASTQLINSPPNESISSQLCTVEKQLRKLTQKRTETVEQGSGDISDQMTAEPSQKIANAILQYLLQGNIDTKLTVLENLDIACWSSKLKIPLAERTFLWLVWSRMTFEKALDVLDHPYYSNLPEWFKMKVYKFVNQNSSEKNRHLEKWLRIKKQKPWIFVKLFESLMKMTELSDEH